MTRPRLLRWLRRAWDVWQQADALRGLWEALRSWGWVALAVLTYGGAVISIIGSIVFVAVGWLASWGPYLVAPIAIVVATVPNFLMWRSRSATKNLAVSPSEQLILVKPLDGSTVTSPFEVRGYANAMEGNIIVECQDESGNWGIIGNTMAGLGSPGELFVFATDIARAPGKHHLRVCAEPFMGPRQYGDCVEIDLTVA